MNDRQGYFSKIKIVFWGLSMVIYPAAVACDETKSVVLPNQLDDLATVKNSPEVEPAFDSKSQTSSACVTGSLVNSILAEYEKVVVAHQGASREVSRWIVAKADRIHENSSIKKYRKCRLAARCPQDMYINLRYRLAYNAVERLSVRRSELVAVVYQQLGGVVKDNEIAYLLRQAELKASKPA
jgi:hypothetical protein